jgi:sulfide:quinone oxidoreductase
MNGKDPYCRYTGYASCPIETSYKTVVMTEFDYSMKPRETFPIDQRKESRLMYIMKRDLMGPLYWHLLLRGWWNGPEVYRKMLRFLKKHN